MILKKIEKEFERFKKKLLYSSKAHKRYEKIQYKLDNMSYEIYDKITNGGFSVQIPTVETIDETLDRILQGRGSISHFGDGEFRIMDGGRIHYQPRSPKLALRFGLRK